MHILDWHLCVCEDCLILIANDEASDAHRKAFKSWQIEYGEGGVLILGDDEETFSSHRCDGCGSQLAGYRHDAFVLVEE